MNYLKKLKLNKFTLIKYLSDGDLDGRVEFCVCMMGGIRQKRTILRNSGFIDESFFFLNVLVKRHKGRYSRDICHHIFRVQTEITNSRIITAKMKWTQISRVFEELPYSLIIQRLKENFDRMHEDQLHFKQDRIVRYY